MKPTIKIFHRIDHRSTLDHGGIRRCLAYKHRCLQSAAVSGMSSLIDTFFLTIYPKKISHPDVKYHHLMMFMYENNRYLNDKYRHS